MHAFVKTGFAKTADWYAARLSAGKLRKISTHVQPVRISASTSMTWKIVPKDTLPTTSTLSNAFNWRLLSSMNLTSLACE